MKLGALSLTRKFSRAWIFLWFTGINTVLWLAPCAGAQDVRSKLGAGEVIVSTHEVPGTSVKRAEMIGVINALPEIVWQVITDVNSFKYFMPRTLNSMAVAAEKLPLILQKRPTQAKEVEQLLGSTPADPISYRIPGGKYIMYFYSHLNFPWPCSNRWYIVKGEQDETRAAQHYYHSSWSLIIGNLKENSGEWILEPFTSTRTKATYKLSTDPGGAIPGFLVDRGTCTTMPQIIEAIRERAEKLCRLKQP